jgi:1,4-dihydroxy-2-naphthoate octaprenyltransferase
MKNILHWTNMWMKAARAPFLTVSFIPAILGGAIAWKDGSFDWTIWLLTTIGIVLAHSAADFIDDYFDYKNGNLGNKEQQFHDSPLIRKEITPRQVLYATFICLIPAIGIGVYLFTLVGWPVLWLTAVGTFIVFFYTSPPFRLNYRGLGETALFIAFGPMIVFGVYYVLSNQFSWEPILVSIPIGIFTMNVGLVSNTFDYDEYVKSKNYTFPVRFGRPNAVKVLNIGTAIAFLLVIVSALAGLISFFSLSILILIYMAVVILNNTKKFKEPDRYTKTMGTAIALTSLTGLLLTLGYIGEILLAL